MERSLRIFISHIKKVSMIKIKKRIINVSISRLIILLNCFKKYWFKVNRIQSLIWYSWFNNKIFLFNILKLYFKIGKYVSISSSQQHKWSTPRADLLLCYLFILIFRKYLRNIARKQTCNMFLLIDKKKHH